MRFCPNKDVDQLVRSLVASGWTFEIHRKHNRLVSPEGVPVFIAKTPSDGKALRNIKADLRRYTGWDGT